MTRHDEAIEDARAVDDAFSVRENIFLQESLLDVCYVPGPDRIVGRNEEIRRLAGSLSPATVGDSPNNVFLYGKTGTGKSLCAKYATKRTVEAAVENDITVGRVVVDCSQEDTETRAVRCIARELNDPEETDIVIPETGLGRSRYYTLLWDVLDSRFDVAFIVLDEIDHLETDDILMQLSRAAESEKISRCALGIIGISNKIGYRDRLQERVKSSLQEREIVFAPYGRDKLREILRSRADAFQTDTLSNEVITECATLAAEEHGDARKAIDLLRHAGEVARSNGETAVGVDHVREANELAERDRFRELLAGATDQQKATLLSVVLLALSEKTRTFKTPEIYTAYEEICADTGLEVLSKRRVHDLLREWEFLEVLDIVRTGDGRARGSYLEHHLVEDPSVIRSVFNEDGRFSGVGFAAGPSTNTWSNI
ncbi:cell division control protein Cdc6 [Halogeometricum borinquense]|uniref:ORC1-type DNA replication protein n=2 Tax=Halogeometricum borinquense TaxID=60847 RepID=E4NVI9_HALBP|nr:orc1/cdc6 family replication initiation protein [Halogeometricum borinquense]ADQ68873.1 ORC complex protein Cdc6/Orc1 [Halogeometricum borinquense DSM 11551]RYJ08063.1 cell division control protein Cdc6 [Halogeometricum borinquense]